MSGVVSSVGVLAILASCWFATNAMWSVPSTFKQTPDSLEFSGSTLSVPKTGELVRTVGGQEKQIEKVIKATRLPEGEITQGTPSGEVIQEYLDYARRTPGTGIYVDLAGKGKYPAGVEWGGMWAKAVMIEPDRLIVNPGSKLYGKGAPTISIIEMRDAGPAAAGGMKY
jgi:hypothetical protein